MLDNRKTILYTISTTKLQVQYNTARLKNQVRTDKFMKRIVWTGDYQPYRDCLNAACKSSQTEYVAILTRAAENLRTYINLDYVPDDSDLAIVSVEGYECVVCVERATFIGSIQGKNIIEFYELVSPFDHTRVYPIQRAALKLAFELY